MKYKVHSLKGDIFFSLFASDSDSCLEILNFSYSKRAEIKKTFFKEISKDFNKMPCSSSISYSKEDAAICFSFDNLKLGIDIESKERFLNESLSKRIRNKAKKLNLKNLEYLCLLESSFKSKQIEKDDLQSYSFKRESEMLVLRDVSYKIFSKTFETKNLYCSLSICT